MLKFAMDRNFFRVIFASLTGAILEWYDFTIYVFLAPVLSHLFFPTESIYLSTMLAYGVFAVGYLARPVGAIFFGHYGDRIGRQKTLAISMLLLSLSTVTIGFLPTYAEAGIWAPVLLVLLRIVQGLSAAGEIVGAVVFTFESSPSRHRGLMATSVWIGSSFGVILASLIVAFLSGWLSAEQMNAWGWRLPFYLGVVTAVMAFFIRKRTEESVYFSAMVKRGEVLTYPLLTVLRSYKAEFFKIVLIFIPGAINYYIYFIFLPTYSVDFLGHALPNVLLINSLTLCSFFLAAPVFAYFSDRLGRKPFLIIALVANFLMSVTLFNLVATGTLQNFFIAQIIFAVIHCFYIAAALSTSLESVPTRIRYSLVGLAYNLSYALFGGTAPIVVGFLIHRFKSLIAPAFYIMLAVLIAFFVVIKMRETHKEVIM